MWSLRLTRKQVRDHLMRQTRMWKTNSALSSNCYLFLAVKWPQDTVSISVVTFVWLMWVSCQGNWLILLVKNVWTESSFCWAYYDKSCGFNLYVWVILFKWLQKKMAKRNSAVIHIQHAGGLLGMMFVICGVPFKRGNSQKWFAKYCSCEAGLNSLFRSLYREQLVFPHRSISSDL